MCVCAYNIIYMLIFAAFTGRDVFQSGRMFKPWISQLEEFIQGFEDVAVLVQMNFLSAFPTKPLKVCWMWIC